MELQKPFIFHLTYQPAAVWLKNHKDLISDRVSQALATSNAVCVCSSLFPVFNYYEIYGHTFIITSTSQNRLRFTNQPLYFFIYVEIDTSRKDV